jgi:hypothetical protein
MVVYSCGTHDNYLIMKSTDGSQNFQINTENILIIPASIIDTSILHTKIQNYNYSNRDFPTIVKNISDRAFVLIKIDRVDTNTENEIFISLFGEIHNNNITKLYLYEVGQTKCYWKAENANFSIKEFGKNKYLILDATLRAVKYDTSCTIRFPYTAAGGIDNITPRYISIESRSKLSSEMLEYFTQKKF